MKRICLMGAAVAGLCTIGVTSAAVAAAPTKSVKVSVTGTKLKPETKSATLNLSCTLALVTQVSGASTAVSQGATTGTQYGNAPCGKKLSSGVTRDSFSADEAGDLLGPFQQWFNDGTIYGKFTLTPGAPSGPPTTTSFETQSYAGTVTISGGRGGLLGTTGKGTLSCTTSDAAHYACTEKLTLTQTVKVLVPVKVKVTKTVKVPAS